MIAPEALASWGVTPEVTGLPWFKTGVIPPAGTEYNYWADNYTLFYLEAIAMNFAELKRLQDYKWVGVMRGAEGEEGQTWG
jgi:light-harvesting complex I chlorophyll a/b binding protein 3